MADDSVSSNLSWNDILVDYQVAKTAAEAVSIKPACRVRELIFETFAETVRTIQHAPAPNLNALVEKLHVYWRAGDLGDGSYGNDFRRKIIGDLRRIALERAGVDGPEASGRLDPLEIQRRWADAFRDYEHCSQLISEGASDTDNLASKDDAEALLLSLPAPNVAAVITKLEILWQDQDWFGSVADTSLHAGIIGELQRFALEDDSQA
jgi:hypothetical protein